MNYRILRLKYFKTDKNTFQLIDYKNKSQIQERDNIL